MRAGPLQSGGNVYFEPASACATGNVTTPYTDTDDRGRISNPVNITVTVGGITGQLYNFEDGVDTWAAASFHSSPAGNVAQSTIDATRCTHSLQINATASGGWFGPSYNTGPLPISTSHRHPEYIHKDVPSQISG